MDPLSRQRALYEAIDQRRRDLGWQWQEVVDATDVTYETIRALKDPKIRQRRPSTTRQLEIGLGWEPGSVALIEAGQPPKEKAGWRPPGRSGKPGQENYERTLLAALGLPAADLAEAQARYDAEHVAIRVIAEAVAEVAAMDIDETVRDVLFAAARNSIRGIFESERARVQDFTALSANLTKNVAP